jgi:hypothetical protein
MTFVPPTVPTVPNAPSVPNARTNGALPNGARAAKAPGASARMKSLQKREKDAARVSGKRAPKGAAAAPRANKKK